MSSHYVEFIPNHKNNILVPLMDIQNNPVENVLPPPVNPYEEKYSKPQKRPRRGFGNTNEMSNYYLLEPMKMTNRGRSAMPDDAFIRYFYSSISIIGLYVVYRILLGEKN